jgi:hypothetical protein
MLKHNPLHCCHLLLCLVIILIYISSTASGYDITRGMRPLMWKAGSFDWTYESAESIFKSSGRYLSKNVMATRVQIYRDYAIAAFPLFRPRVPVTLAKTSLKHKNFQPTFSAFPCWSLQKAGNCHVGIVNTLEQPIRRCPPTIVAPCAKSGKVLQSGFLRQKAAISRGGLCQRRTLFPPCERRHNVGIPRVWHPMTEVTAQCCQKRWRMDVEALWHHSPRGHLSLQQEIILHQDGVSVARNWRRASSGFDIQTWKTCLRMYGLWSGPKVKLSWLPSGHCWMRWCARFISVAIKKCLVSQV